jgi:hypothetical protein
MGFDHDSHTLNPLRAGQGPAGKFREFAKLREKRTCFGLIRWQHWVVSDFPKFRERLLFFEPARLLWPDTR